MKQLEEILVLHRRRCFAINQRNRLNNALGAYIRLQLGWSKAKPEKEREQIAKEAAACIKNNDEQFADMIGACELACAPFDQIEAGADKDIKSIVRQLPVWKEFGAGIRGFGEASLGTIIAEAGDLNNYATDGKLWKRMGVAVLDGVRQGGLSKNAKADDWVAHGYSPARRSRLWNIGQSLIKQNDGAYRAAYDHRRAHTMVTHPEWWADAEGNPKVDKNGKPSSAHGAADAQRYMEKRLLRDLRQAWRRPIVIMAEKPGQTMASASSSQPGFGVAERPDADLAAPKRRPMAALAETPVRRVASAPSLPPSFILAEKPIEEVAASPERRPVSRLAETPSDEMAAAREASS
jgi:hypothetical protein